MLHGSPSKRLTFVFELFLPLSSALGEGEGRSVAGAQQGLRRV